MRYAAYMAAQDQDQDPRNLHDLAVDCQSDIQKLATGLAHAGAAPQAVAQLTKMASVISDIVKVLGEGPQVGAGQPPQPGQEPGGPPPGPPPGPPQGPPPGAPQPQQPGPGPDVQKHTLQSASAALHAAVLAHKAANPGQ